MGNNRKNIGGTKLFGMDLDPNKDLCLVEDDVKGQKAFYKDEPMKYLDYYEELANREIKLIQGKDAGGSSIGIFSGFGDGTLKKPFKEIN